MAAACHVVPRSRVHALRSSPGEIGKELRKRNGRSRRDTQKAGVVGQRSQIINSQHGSITSSRVRWTSTLHDERPSVKTFGTRGDGGILWRREEERRSSFRDTYRRVPPAPVNLSTSSQSSIKLWIWLSRSRIAEIGCHETGAQNWG